MESEAALLRRLLIAGSARGARLFRNQVGHYVIAHPNCLHCQRDGRRISSGMAVGSPDLVGWQSVTITPDMVGRTVALFVGVEAKRPGGGVVSEDQRRFLTALEQAGAIAGVVRSIADLDALLSPP